MLKKPSQLGFQREVVKGKREDTLDEFGNVVEGKQRIDIYYVPPVGKGKRLRSLREAEEYLSKHQPEGLSLENFSFSKKKLGLGDEFEIVRQSEARRPRENKISNKIGASRKKHQPAADIREKKTSGSGKTERRIVVSQV